jgi:peptidoglycan/LPS O-acetylase OafA/YrhL
MTYRYFARCATLLAGVEYQLPGVFERNPYRAVVNGSLWTMPFEIRMYAILVLLGAVFGLLRATRARTFELCLVVLAVMAGASLLYLHFERPVENAFLRLFFMFFSGSAYFVLRDRISISLPTSAALLLAVVGTAWIGRDIFFVAYVLTLAYIILGFAYCRSEWAGKYNRLGDYSYGVYIYAFPVQQTVLALRPNTTVSELLCLSAPVTLTLAICSWHWIERHALAQKWRVGRGPSNRDTEKRRWL